MLTLLQDAQTAQRLRDDKTPHLVFTLPCFAEELE
jgi:hypothetical protein